MSAASRWLSSAALVLTLLSAPGRALAQSPEQRPWPRLASTSAASVTADRFEIAARSETYLHVFRRALLPGPAGALVLTETAAPFTQYLAARATDVDSPWHRDALDFEVAAWGQVWPTTSGYERPFDGDVQSANVRYRVGRHWLRLGRQLAVGGAARFARFDGLMASGGLESGVSLSAYGGAAVLPRWDALPGYHQLGAAERELLSGAPLSLDRSQQWLAGARVGYEGARVRGALSFHEQREGGGLGRRNLGVDLGGQPLPALGYGASALLELSDRRLADLRAWIDLEPHRLLRLSLEALRTEPSLFLSRQSVLSVFSAEGYRELGGYVSTQPLPWLRLEGSGFGQVYDLGRPGARAELAARIDVDRYYATSVRVGYSRVLIGDAGYEALRASLLRQLTRSLRATAELYGFFYDQPVQGYRASAVYSTTLDFRASDRLAFLWGASLSRSPYSRLDAQTLVRVTYDLDARPRESSW